MTRITYLLYNMSRGDGPCSHDLCTLHADITKLAEDIADTLSPDEQFAIIIHIRGEKRRRVYETRLRSIWHSKDGYTITP
ncbi:hypothetical protein [Stappia sp. WLB 29]|uniref:hypothetical protein n=1 Tax=Stappia sp. WLB 29 TaxID=2925220 RepID=UPI0020C032FF|nr:hypothetical protein [Stappia sp. WLB 29]